MWTPPYPSCNTNTVCCNNPMWTPRCRSVESGQPPLVNPCDFKKKCIQSTLLCWLTASPTACGHLDLNGRAPSENSSVPASPLHVDTSIQLIHFCLSKSENSSPPAPPLHVDTSIMLIHFVCHIHRFQGVAETFIISNGG